MTSPSIWEFMIQILPYDLTEMRWCSIMLVIHLYPYHIQHLEPVDMCSRLEAPPHFSQVVRQYLNHKFPNWWIGCGGAQNWPPRSPYLNPLDYHVWGYMKAMVYGHKVNRREELLQWILSAARSINNTAMLHRVTSSLVTQVRKCIQADGGHVEQFAWMLNGKTVTVHLTA